MKQPDPITLTIIENTFISTAEEMSAALIRSSYSPIIREMLDASCAVFDGKGRLIAQAENVPAQLGFMTFAVKYILSNKGESWFKPGDVVILNHPFFGGNHTPDVFLFLPVFLKNELVAICGNCAHHIDVGGAQPGTEGYDNSEIFQEGLLFSAMKLIEKGIPNEQLFELIKDNVRDPQSTLGDLRAQIASNKMGERRLVKLFSEFGIGMMNSYMDAILAHSEKMVRADLEALPDGEASADGYLDDDGVHSNRPVRISVKVTKKGSDIGVDFSGTDPQMTNGFNLPLSSAYSAAYFAVRCLVDQRIPQNDGCYKTIKIVAPKGTLINPNPPAAVSARHMTAQRQVDTILRALADLYPERLGAGSCAAFPTLLIEILDPATGQIKLVADLLGGGMGGRNGFDGLDGVDVYLSNCGLLPAEVCEIDAPVRIEVTELVRDSGGAGKYRGGLAIRRDYRILAESAYVNAYFDQGNPAFAPWGLLGGKAGASAQAIVNIGTEHEERLRMLKAHLKLRSGDVVTMISSGGGGYGDPRERPPERVREDVRDGKIGLERAQLEYP
jgi:N-methylhydantoinase B